MKKVLKYILFIAFAVLLTGCKNQTTDIENSVDAQGRDISGKECIFSTKYSVADAYIRKGEHYGLVIPYIYKGDFKDIKLIETKGEDVGTANIKLVVEPEGACIQTEYNGYKYGQCGLCVGLNGRDVKITDIVLSVDGKEETLHFDKELIYRTCEDSDALSWGTCPASSLGGASKEMDMSFEMFARKDVVINRVLASSNYDVKVISCEINDESDMSENKKLYEEDKIRFFCKFIKKTDSIFCVTSFIVEYTDEDGKAGKAICPFNASINIIDEEKVPEIMKKIYEEQV